MTKKKKSNSTKISTVDTYSFEDAITISELIDDEKDTSYSWESMNDTYSLTNTGSLSTTLGSYGSVGATLSTSGLGFPNWTNNTITATASPYTIAAGTGINSTGNWTSYNNQPQVLKVAGNAEFDGDIKIKGVDLADRLDAIEERLAILRPNHDLEGKWEKLKALGDEYRKLEQEILKGENMWDILKR